MSLPSPAFSSLVDLLQHRAEHHPERVLYRFLKNGEGEAGQLTYGALGLRARAIAKGLRPHIAPGERVILLFSAQEPLAFVQGLFGAIYGGAIAIPTYPPRSGWNDLKTRLQDSQAQIILSTAALQTKLAKPWQKFLKDWDGAQAPRWLTLEAMAEQSPNGWQPPAISSETLAYFQYTSGSTGTPKGVMVSHGNVLYNSAMIQTAFGHGEGAKILSWLPFNHDMGLVGGLMQALYVGGESVLMAPVDFIQKPIRWLRALAKYQTHSSGGPNFAYDLLCDRITPAQMDGLDLSHWRIAYSGAEPIRAETLTRFTEKFSPWGFRAEAFYPCYGMAEATLMITGSQKSDRPIIQYLDEKALAQNQVVLTDAQEGRPVVGCGRSWLDGRLKIVNPHTLTPCGPGEIGEIWAQGSGLGQGYWQRPEVTQETFQAHLADSGEGPFLRTGDFGYLDGEELFITGRLKEVMIFWARYLYPPQVEDPLNALDERFVTNGTAAFSINVEGTERLAIAQELTRSACRDFTPETAQKLAKRIRRKVLLTHFLDVEAIAFLKPGQLPRTTSGKIQRRRCAQLLMADELGAMEIWRCPPQKRVDFGRWTEILFKLDIFKWFVRFLNL